MIVHHGTTTEALPGILADGLRPHAGLHGHGVWATPSADVAAHYATDPLRAGDPVVLTFTVDDTQVTGRRGPHVLLAGTIDPSRLHVDREPHCRCHPA